MAKRTLTPERAELAALHVAVADRALKVFLRRKHIPLQRWPGVEWDDLTQVCREALCYAAMDWKPGAGPFPPFAYNRCWFRMIDWLRTEGPYTRYGEQRVRTVSWMDETNLDWFVDSAPPTETLLRDEQLVQDHADVVVGREWVVECMRFVTAREEYILRSTLVEGRRGSSLAKEMGISEGRVSMIAKRAIEKIRRAYAYGEV